jgi:hypothetical protein
MLHLLSADKRAAYDRPGFSCGFEFSDFHTEFDRRAADQLFKEFFGDQDPFTAFFGGKNPLEQFLDGETS